MIIDTITIFSINTFYNPKYLLKFKKKTRIKIYKYNKKENNKLLLIYNLYLKNNKGLFMNV